MLNNSKDDRIASAVTEYWRREFRYVESSQSHSPITLSVVCQDEENDLSILNCVSGWTGITMSPQIADILSLGSDSIITDMDNFYQQLRDNDLPMHGADYLYYLPDTPMKADKLNNKSRMLDVSDREQVSAFQAKCSEEDLDNAYVELDHWAVAGLFFHDQLVSMASAYPWEESAICDIGIITAPEMRHKGHGNELLRMLIQYIMSKNYIPQYRCQLDNHASIALAKSLGFLLYGTWNTLAEIS